MLHQEHPTEHDGAVLKAEDKHRRVGKKEIITEIRH